ncbi:divalent-cation tolerance protein CutA [Nonomuraea pusilla]|uniref:divalent-cation tolerance protein CutA n=1 Tax=Nonomuraea pusilla TaxID=46177 RepID=UPI003331347C
MTEFIEVRVTAPSREEAERICSAVVAERLASCAQITGLISSTYWWNDEIQQADEWMLLMKTTRVRFEDLAALVQELHSYEVPEIVAVPLVAGTGDYLEWIRRETSPRPGA